VSVSVRYDRELLLGEPKRHQILELREVLQYGEDSFGDPDYLSLYGLPPAAWYERGVRILGRTAVECTRDRLGDLIGRDVAELVRTAPAARPLVVDPFAGSANTLYWIQHHLSGSRALGFELDEGVYEASSRNLSILRLDLELRHTHYEAGLRSLTVAEAELLVIFIAPPWGNALDQTRGLDLAQTTPPVTSLIDLLTDTLSGQHLIAAIQIYETVDPSSLENVRARFEWSAVETYDIDPPGRNHGLLLGTIRCKPPTFR
jgi:hypothetical protein